MANKLKGTTNIQNDICEHAMYLPEFIIYTNSSYMNALYKVLKRRLKYV
jgi:hypothetical protein